MNSQGNSFSSKETYDFQVLGKETLIIAGYKAIKISSFHKLALKLWLRENDMMIYRNNPLIFIQPH